MIGRVIQGYFTAPRAGQTATPATGQQAIAPNTRSAPGPPPPAFGGRAVAAQARLAPGRPPLVYQTARIAPPFGGGSFEIDPIQIGLARGGGGQPLPQAVLAKMEAAFGADFSAVRVNVGPQATRIGAVAFTMGDDLYFAPGKFQPHSIQGQQLIGHELAHVIQQRQGRVRAPTSGLVVVQDRALEAEADRLGMRAAMASPQIAQRKSLVAGPLAVGRTANALPRVYAGHRALQRSSELVKTTAPKFKKKGKQRAEQAKVDQTLDEQIHSWVEDYGHALDRHVNMTTTQLDERRIPLATTFESSGDLLMAVEELLTSNEQKINSWFKNEVSERKVLWAHMPASCAVRGRQRNERNRWEPDNATRTFSDFDADELVYIVGIFDRDAFYNKPKGLVTCYPASEKP